MKLCQSTVKWQDADGNIHERWAYYQSASKYDVGKTGNNIIFVGSNNYTVIVPQDDDTLGLDGKRVFLDIREVPNDVFTFTRDDNVLYHLVLNMVVYYLLSLIKMNLTHRKTEKTCDYVITLNLKKILSQRSQRNQNSQMLQLWNRHVLLLLSIDTRSFCRQEIYIYRFF